MAEYGLYGAMVRHSLPLPDAILRSREENDEDDDDDSFESDIELSESEETHGDQKKAVKSIQENDPLSSPNEPGEKSRTVGLNGCEKKKEKVRKKKVKHPIAPWLLG